MKKLLNLVACLALALHLNACTSNDSRDESEDGAVAEDTLETEESADAALEDDGSGSTGEDTVVAESNEGFLDEQLPEDALGESTPAPEVASEAPVVEETPMTEETPLVAESEVAPVMEETPADTSSVASEPPASEPVAETPPPMENTDSFAAVDTGSSVSSEAPAATETPAESSFASTEEKPKPASLKKVEAIPFKRSGVLLNAVYLARPGDSFASISKNIYGDESKTRELKKINPYFSKVRPGDKVYYNSPMRPTDDTKVLTHYEDAGMVSETYVAKEGDNIRTVAKELLGYDNAWKEIWTTNSVDSKSELAAGTELRYWRSAPVAAAAPTPAPPTMTESVPPPPPPPAMAQNEMPPMPPPEMNMPPPPAMDMPQDQAMAGGIQDLPPPPPAEAVNPPPPPPPPVVAQKAPKTEENIGGLDNDMIMTLGGAGILVAAIALLMIVRKRRQQKEMSAAFGDTHVGT